MAYVQLTNYVPQWHASDNTLASGQVIKAYLAGTSTGTNLFADSSGTSAGTSIALNARGEPEVSGNTVIPYLDDAIIYKLSLYPTQAAADADSGAIWTVDNINPASLTSSFKMISQYGDSLATAITDIGATETTLWIDKSISVTADATVPSNITLKFLHGGNLNVSATKTVTINGGIEAGNYQIFTGSGSVVAGASFKGKCNLLWFGATGDGSTDDTTFIQKAVDFYTAVGGDIFSPFTVSYYKLTSAISLKSNLTIEGDYAQFKQTTANTNVFTGTSISGTKIKGLHLYCAGTFSSITNGQGVLLDSSTDCTVEKCKVENALGTGICLNNSNECYVYNNKLVSSPLLDSDTTYGADIAVQGNSSGNIVSGNQCISGTGIGIALQTVTSGDTANYNIIYGNNVKDCKVYGIMAYRKNLADSCRWNMISGNIVNNITGSIDEGSGKVFGAGIYCQGSEHASVTNNKIHSVCVQTAVDSLAPGGIGSTNLTNIYISGNYITSSAMFGITVRDPNNEGSADGYGHINGNTVNNSTKSGIYIKDRSQIKVTGNVVDNSTESGIEVANTSTESVIAITDNEVRSSGQNGITLDNINNVRINNNTCQANGIHGVSLSNVDKLSVGDNISTDNTSGGIVIGSGVTKGHIFDNFVEANGTGMSLASNCRLDNNRVENNTVNWAGTYQLVRTFSNGDTSPDVTDGRYFKTANTGATTIDAFDGGHEGQEILVVLDANTTIDFTGTSLKGNGSSNFNATADDALRCTKIGTNWHCQVINA